MVVTRRPQLTNRSMRHLHQAGLVGALFILAAHASPARRWPRVPSSRRRSVLVVSVALLYRGNSRCALGWRTILTALTAPRSSRIELFAQGGAYVSANRQRSVGD